MFSLEFFTDNDAFDQGRHKQEIPRILSAIALAVAKGDTAGTVYDHDNYRVGEWSLEMSEE